MSVYSSSPAAKESQNFLQKLSSIQIGGGGKQGVKIKKRDMVFILRNISILVENGLSLPRSLDALVNEKSLRKYSHVLQDVKQRVESGEAFSAALARFPDSFPALMVEQVRIGERSGTIPATLSRIMNQLEHADNLKSLIIKKLTYPALLVTAGSGAVTFMLLYVVPTFENVYSESGAKLPGVTQALIEVGRFGTAYGWIILLGIIALVTATVVLRRDPATRLKMDASMLKVPYLGQWLTNISVLQFMEVLGNLMDAGFTVVEALNSCSNAVSNRAVQQRIEQMHEALLRGERFSTELQKQADLFPPVVNQLVSVGERTGTLSKTTLHIRAHLRREVEAYTNLMVGTIEPVTTVGLAAVIGCILLAIYLPMFDMISAMG